MNKRKILNDPLYGFITIPTDLIFDLIGHRYFQRLRRIKQVGMTHYVYPGALHTRFQHALGAMHLMGQAITTLRLKGHLITPEEEEGAQIAILLHDIGHGPYSHALEYLLLPVAHEDITLHYMRLLNAEFDGQLSMAIRIFEGSYPRRFLNQLVSGQLDMDRMDYLMRDSFFTGVAEGVIGHDRIIAMLNVADDEIVVEEKGLFSIEKFLVARRLMYLQVYLHKTVIAAEQMIRKLIATLRNQITRENHPSIPAPLKTLLGQHNAPFVLSAVILEVFASLDDVEVDYTLKLLTQSQHPVLALLAGGLVERRLFRTLFSDQPFTPETIREAAVSVSSALHLTVEQALELVITGMEVVPTYDPAQGDIRILRKNGSVVDLPSLMEEHSTPRNYTRHYLCMPAHVRHV